PFANSSDFGHVTNHIFPVVLPPEISRSKVMQTMKDRGVETSIHYRSVHTFSAYANSEPFKLPVSEDFSQRTLTLPLYPKMIAADVEYVCESLAVAAKPG